MKTLLLSLLAIGSLHAAPQAIFDGKSLEGWVVENAPYWTVKDGVLIGESDETENKKKGSTLWTTKEYKDFSVETEFRFTGVIDSGIFIKKSGDQIQIGTSGSLKRDMTGSPYIAKLKKYPVEAEGISALLKEGEWNKMKVTVKGKTYTVELNGKKVLEYTSETAADSGPIGLQVHPNVLMKVEFRNLVAEEL